MKFRGAVRVKREMEKFCSWKLVILLVSAVFTIVVTAVAPIVSDTAYASSRYACYDKPCAQERKEYVDEWAGRACAFARSLKRLLDRKARGERTRAGIVARLNRCLAINLGRRGRCAFHARRLRAIDRTLSDIQRRLDRFVSRLQASCNASLPGGVAANPPTCEQQEALRYCPIADELQAERSMEQRCADLRAEQAQQAVCGNCVNPKQLIAAASYSDDLWTIAQLQPTCAPVPTVTPLATLTPSATGIPEQTATPESTDTPEPTATSEPTVTPVTTPCVSVSCQ